MIERISAPIVTGKTTKLTAKKNEQACSNNVMSNPVVSLSFENARANFMPIVKRNNVSFTGLYNELQMSGATSNDTPAVNMTSITPIKMYKGNYYAKAADDLATAMGPDKGAILTHKPSTIPDMLVQDFTKAVKAGKYEHLGYNADTTNISVIDFDKYAEKSPAAGLTKVYKELANIPKNGVKTAKVVFIKGYEKFIMATQEIPMSFHYETSNEKKDVEFSLYNLIKNQEELAKSKVHVVGFMNDKLAELCQKDNLSFEERQVLSGYPGLKEIVKEQMSLPMNGLSTTQTKELLKKDDRFISGVLYKYAEANHELKISEKAIDKIVDKAATGITGTFPAKALQVLDLIAADKSIKNQKLINENDVDSFFIQKASLLEAIKDKSDFKAVENVKTRLEDVGGLHKAKEDVQDIISFLKNPNAFLATGKAAPKGALFAGSPGTGKTYFASAVAGSCDVPFVSVSASSFVNKYVGVGAANVRAAFAKARQLASDSGKNAAVLFIDELDSVGKKRGSENNGEVESTLNAMLTEMDGLETKNSNVKIVVLAATNRADMLDDALKRPGRFDAVVSFEPPATKAETREILNVHAKNLKFADDVTKNKVLDEMAERLTGHSGADISRTVETVKKVVGERVANTFKDGNAPKSALFITSNDFTEAYLRALEGRVNVENETAVLGKERTVVHEAGHAMVKNFFKPEGLDFISNQSRGDYLGVTFVKPSKENPRFESVIQDIACDYAGNGAEKRFAKVGDAGWSGDLEHVALRIKYAIQEWGLGIHAPKMNLKDNETRGLYNEEIKQDINIFEKTASYVSDQILDFHKDFLTKDYMNKFREESKSGMGGNVLSGSEFTQMVKDWVKANGKEDELAKLHSHINEVIEKASQGDLSFLNPAKPEAESMFKKFIKLFK